VLSDLTVLFIVSDEVEFVADQILALTQSPNNEVKHKVATQRRDNSS